MLPFSLSRSSDAAVIKSSLPVLARQIRNGPRRPFVAERWRRDAIVLTPPVIFVLLRARPEERIKSQLTPEAAINVILLAPSVPLFFH